ncbi:MAG: alanine-tRNA synthetase second additional domain-containing protein [Sphaerochaetaceae bacterium]|nr:alanine-tRNA synthetase second additional domain-containing protein [Sphaerochaetaceae bacterium]
MAYSDRMQKNHLYTVFFAPRGLNRIADLGMQIAQQYLSPFDKLIGLVGSAGAGKSMLIKGMFPGLELTNDDAGVNVRPLPLLGIADADTGFYTPHTYHVDIRFEAAFTQMHELASIIKEAMMRGKRVVVEHFELVYPYLNQNAHLLIGIGEEVIITRPTLFGPEPQDIANIVFKSLPYRLMTHTAEDLCSYLMQEQGCDSNYLHADVRHGFILSFLKKPDIDLNLLEKRVNEAIAQDIPVSYKDDHHIMIGDKLWVCSGPRFHVKSTKEIGRFTLSKELFLEPITERYLLVGVVGEFGEQRISDLNKIYSA